MTFFSVASYICAFNAFVVFIVSRIFYISYFILLLKNVKSLLISFDKDVTLHILDFKLCVKVRSISVILLTEAKK